MKKLKAEYMTVAQAARYLNRHENTIRNWVKDGTLPHRRGGRSTIQLLIPIEAVEKLADDLAIGRVLED